MPRRLPSGTPTRATEYEFPQRGQRMLLASGGVGAAIAVLLLGLYFAGVDSALSPGPVVAPHAPIGTECALCHSIGSAIEDVRCERCHDSAATLRLTNEAHVLFGSGDARKASDAAELQCNQCHTDHRGRDYALAAADDRECAACHEFSGLRRHPEFAAVSANTQTGLGMKFPHERHLAVDAANGACDVCHVPTPDLDAFEPISFAQQCASCHVDSQGRLRAETTAIPAELLVQPDAVPAEWAQDLIEVQPQARRRLVITGMVHRDPWVLYNAIKLRREIDPLGDRAERAVLESQRAWLQQRLRSRPLRAVATTDLEALRDNLRADIDELAERLQETRQQTDPQAELLGLVSAMESISAGLAADASGSLPADLVSEAAEAVATLRAELDGLGAEVSQAAADPGAAAALEAQRAELSRVLDAVIARGDAVLSNRAAALRSRLDDLPPPGETTTESGREETGQLQEHLERLDEALRVAASGADLGGRYEAASIDVLRKLGRQRVGGGLSPEAFETRRQEILDLLDIIERRGDDAARLHAADLRQQAIDVRPGDSGDTGLERRLAERRTLLARVDLEIELDASAGAGHRQRPLAFGSLRDGVAIGAAIDDIDRRLDELRRGPRSNAASLPDERAVRSRALQNLLAPCLKCHEMSGSKLDPVQIALPVMTRSVFNHAPHVTQVTCGACHGDPGATEPGSRLVFVSKLASDVNTPGIANCQTCHAPAQVSDQCETCHLYHPPSITSLLNLR